MKGKKVIISSEGHSKTTNLEILSLCTNVEFLEIIQQSRNELKEGKTLKLEQMKKELEIE